MMSPRLLSLALALLVSAPAVHADDARSEFIRGTADEHGIDAAAIEAKLGDARFQQSIINAMTRPAEAKPWSDYRPIFLTQERIRGGRAFLAEHREALERIEAETGVPAEMVVSIIGVETFYGRVKGNFRVLDALYTLGFHYPPRQDFFRRELAHLFALVEEQDLDIDEIRGSYAGAMGWGQFIPSSYRAYARDGDGDGRIDLFESLPDVFASVANYFAEHGWRAGEPIAVPAVVEPGTEHYVPENYHPRYSVAELAEKGYRPAQHEGHDGEAGLVHLEGSSGRETWMVFNNFYVITRYNRSPLYAMAVMQLAEEIAAGGR